MPGAKFLLLSVFELTRRFKWAVKIRTSSRSKWGIRAAYLISQAGKQILNFFFLFYFLAILARVDRLVPNGIGIADWIPVDRAVTFYANKYQSTDIVDSPLGPPPSNFIGGLVSNLLSIDTKIYSARHLASSPATISRIIPPTLRAITSLCSRQISTGAFPSTPKRKEKKRTHLNKKHAAIRPHKPT